MGQIVAVDFFRNHNLASAGYLYGRFAQQFQSLPKAAKTSGSSATWVDVTSGDNFAAAINVGDELYEPIAGTRVLVIEKASNASITVSAAADLGSSGKNLHVRPFASGTTVTDGWVDCSNLMNKSVSLQVDELAGTSITFTIEGRVPGSAPMTIYTSAALVADTINSEGLSNLAPIEIPESISAVRVGAKIDTDSGTNSISARLFGVLR
jgi:hypothetical protein